MTKSNTFSMHLKRALESFAQPELMGSESPLAAPYFLGAAMQGAGTTPLGRGQALQAEIMRAVESLWGGPLPEDGQEMLELATAGENQGGRYDCLLLELNYFKQRYQPAPRNQAAIYHDILHISRPTHDRHLRKAIDRLGALLLLRLRPAIRPEQPAAPQQLIGRDPVREEVLNDLVAGKTVSLAGAGGVGKTSLAAAVVEEWLSPAVFWYTLRPTFNDQLESLLFALGHFLHVQGSSTLWRQLVADSGRIKDAGLALGLVLDDLGKLELRPLLCFDDLDFLRPLNQDQPKVSHVQLLEFLDSLRGHAPLLLIGQQVFWQGDATYGLEGIGRSQLEAWLHAHSVAHSEDDVARLYDYSGGNPRIAELCIALYQAGERESLAAIVDQLPRSRALLPLWHRLAQRLPADERRLLQALSIFRSPAPADVWSGSPDGEPTALDRLSRRHLLQRDEYGGVAVMPALREVIYDDQSIENREQYHLQAANVRAERGDYTAAAYHLMRAGQPEAAVATWYPVSAVEINRGRGRAALEIFTQISQRRLSAKRRRELLLVRGELYQLTGEPEKVIESLDQATWAPDEETTIDAALLWGRALETQGETQGAWRQRTMGIAAATRLLDKLTRLTLQRSLAFLHERDFESAWSDINLATHHLETMKGSLHEQSGQLDEASRHYRSALEHAQALDYQEGLARVYLRLGNVAVRRRESDDAVAAYDRSMAIYEQMGDRVGREVVRSGLAAAYMEMKQYRDALAPARQALRFFEQVQDPYWTALNTVNLAESHLELGELNKAEEQAQRALSLEEPFAYPYALFTLGRISAAQGQEEKARLYLGQAEKIAAGNEDNYLLAYAREELGRLYLHSGDPDTARRLATSAFALFQTQGIASKAAEALELLNQCDASSQENETLIAC